MRGFVGQGVWALLVNFKSTAIKAALNQTWFRLFADFGVTPRPTPNFMEVTLYNIAYRRSLLFEG
jgi:hypothetical protein